MALTSTWKTMIIVGIVMGIYLVHLSGTVHRDLNRANILLDPTSHCPIIADFGLSREGDVTVIMTLQRGTPL
jgi:serine/threonine protein kinase